MMMSSLTGTEKNCSAVWSGWSRPDCKCGLHPGILEQNRGTDREVPVSLWGHRIHPDEAGSLSEERMREMEELLDRIRRGSGRDRLDYYWDKENHDIQKKWFIRQLETARKKDMPVIIHSREAAADTMEIMKTYAAGMRAVIHCYSYSPEMAKEYVKMGYYIGVEAWSHLRMQRNSNRSLRSSRWSPLCWRQTAHIWRPSRSAERGTALFIFLCG